MLRDFIKANELSGRALLSKDSPALFRKSNTKKSLNIIIALLSMLVFSLDCHAEGMVRGINYDPVHSQAFAMGIGTDDQQLMQQSIFNDLDKLRDLENKAGFKITHLKTFFTQYNSLNNKATLNIADSIYQWNLVNPGNELTLALGVYEFRPKIDACTTESECLQWTQSQIDAVKPAVPATA